MEGRRDALVDAAQFVLHVRDAARSIPDAVATVGELALEPGASNVIPARVALSVDARAPDRERLDRLVGAIGFEPQVFAEPTAMDADVRAALREHADGTELISGAGHDAAVLGAAGVRCGMLFVRSQNDGVSHSPDELTTSEDIALAIDALTAALSRLAK
jgi:acetylornithine deacetylase/succinyl-diaminopimelate desuccinylase-like protein